MKPGRVVRLVVLLAAVALGPAGCGSPAGATSSAPAQTIVAPTSSTDAQLSAADQALLADIQTLHDDWRLGKIEIDWPPSGADTPGGILAGFSDLEDVFQWLEQAILAPRVIVFLKDEAGVAKQLQVEVAGWPGVQSAHFVSKEEALARLRVDLKDHPDILEGLQTNALPASIEITASGTEAARAVVERLKERPEVDEVPWTTIGYQFDTMMAWFKSHARPAAAGTTRTSSTSAISLSREEEKRLDKLDAPGVAKAYFESGGPAVEYYLSGPWLREVTSMPNSVPEREREGGIDDLVVEGPLPDVPSQVHTRDEWPQQLHFRVTYTSRKTDSIGQPPGKRLWFVIAGRQTANSPWKILEIGSGP